MNAHAGANRLGDQRDDERRANETLVRWKGEIDSHLIAHRIKFPSDYDQSPKWAIAKLIECELATTPNPAGRAKPEALGLITPEASGPVGLGPRECTPMHAGEDGWTDWVGPVAPYYMQCCDCGLVHEAEFRVAKEKVYKADGSWDAMWATDPNYAVVFRMRRPHSGDVQPPKLDTELTMENQK